MNIYLAYTVMGIFIIFVVIPALTSSVSGDPDYMLNLKAGMMAVVCFVSFIALTGLVMWSALTVMGY